MIRDFSPAVRRARHRCWQRNPRLVASGVATAVVGCILLAGNVYGGLNVGRASTVHVRAGDTVWSLAARHYPGDDLRDRVAQIIAANRLADGTITPGQILELPAP